MDGPHNSGNQASHHVTVKVLETERKLLQIAQQENATYLQQLQLQLEHLEVWIDKVLSWSN